MRPSTPIAQMNYPVPPSKSIYYSQKRMQGKDQSMDLKSEYFEANSFTKTTTNDSKDFVYGVTEKIESTNEGLMDGPIMELIDIKPECIETDTLSKTSGSVSEVGGHFVLLENTSFDQSNPSSLEKIKQEPGEDPLSH